MRSGVAYRGRLLRPLAELAAPGAPEARLLRPLAELAAPGAPEARLLRLRVDRVRVRGGWAAREVVVHPGAAVILPVLPGRRILMVRQYRHAVRRWTWELPAGTLDHPGESPLAAAKRELLEETGWRARRWARLAAFYPSPGFCTERMTIYTASGLAPGGGQRLEADEEIRVRTVPAATLARWIRQGRLVDAKTLVGALLFLSRGAGIR